MGNAAITINYPISLEHEVAYLEAGKLVESERGVIRLEKRETSVTGCGGRVVFRRDATGNQWTFRFKPQVSSNFDIEEEEITIEACDESEARDKLAAKFGMSWSAVSGSVCLVKSVVCDSSVLSELYCYVDYSVKNNSGSYQWTKNDLGLKATHRWAENSEMVMDVTFLTDEEREIEKEKQKEQTEAMRNAIFFFGNNEMINLGQ